MSSPKKDLTSELQRWTAVASDAAMTFRRRWTDLALRRVDGALANLLHEQIEMFNRACLEGDVDEIATHGAGTARGWAAAVRAMEAAGAPDDAYQLGNDPQTGTKVAIGDHKGIIGRVQELHGQDVICITPDEVAVMVASVEAIKGIGEIKKLFPGAEIVRRYENQGS
jgi:hypothetical protein